LKFGGHLTKVFLGIVCKPIGIGTFTLSTQCFDECPTQIIPIYDLLKHVSHPFLFGAPLLLQESHESWTLFLDSALPTPVIVSTVALVIAGDRQVETART